MSETNQIERPVSQHRNKCWHNQKDQTMNQDQIARVCHEVNRAYCQALGDNSQPAWEDAPQWQRDSAMLGVKLHTNNPEASAAASHESWMAQKVAEGWVYGPEKNPELKQHHCIGPSGYTTISSVCTTGQMSSDYHAGRWISHSNDDLTDWGFEPTHWMPLPAAPKDTL